MINALGAIRVYDLWRNDKISRFLACNDFAMSEGKGKKWMNAGGQVPTYTIYTNKGIKFD